MCFYNINYGKWNITSDVLFVNNKKTCDDVCINCFNFFTY